jgi:hypothetical protein
VAPLLPCPTCRRHVRADETRCPFCSDTILRAASPQTVVMPKGRLSRVGIFLFASVSATACGSVQDVGAPSVDATADTLDHGGDARALYGSPGEVGPPFDTATTDSFGASDGDAGTDGDAKDTGGSSAIYGAAPFH